MTRLKILALLVGMAPLFTIPATVSAQSSPPHLLVITSVDGVEPADGITIVAIVNGNDIDTATTAGGSAVLTVDQGDDNFAGETISFTINGSSVPETVAWVSGTAETYELTDSVVTQTTADVFADEVASGNLVIVWRLNTDQTWSFYREGEAFTIPAGPADAAGTDGAAFMSEHDSGDIVLIKVVADTTFQGKALVAGWTFHVLD